MKQFGLLATAALMAGSVSCASNTTSTGGSGGGGGSGAGCSSSSQCPIGNVCGADGACAAEPTSGAAGWFECDVDGGTIDIGVSEVVASVGGTRYPLYSGANCKLAPDVLDGVLIVTLQNVASDGTDLGSMSIALEANRVTAGAGVPLADNTASQPLAAVNSGTLYTGRDEASTTILGLVSGGTIQLQSIPRSGQRLRGFIDVSLRTPGGSSAGTCEDGGVEHANCDACFDVEQNVGGCCGTQLDACQESSDCSGLIECLNACAAGDDTCIEACGQSFSGGVDDFLALGDCLLGSAGTAGACGSICE